MSDAAVTVLRWPEDESIRLGLAALGRPRILLVDEGVRPPEPVDQLEDWLRSPPDPADLLVRSQHLGQRAAGAIDHGPRVDGDGLLRFGSRWVSMSSAQVPVVELLLAHLDRVVPFEQVVDVYVGVGGSGHPASVRTVLARVGARVAEVGLELVTVRQRGVLLRVASVATALDISRALPVS